MYQSVKSAIHCINPGCPRPYPQAWGSKFCQSCGSSLHLKSRYIPLQKLGTGGFATIYTVWDLETQTERVLKVLVEASPKALLLFEQEAEVLTSLRHPGVPKVEPDGYFVETCHGTPHSAQSLLPCLVMEKINGYTLEQMLEHYPQGCPEAWVVNWLNQALAILQELHSRQIIHRDIKPSNLMLRSSTAQLVLIDFGGAKQIGPGLSRQASTRLFSSGYSPPEQIAGSTVGPSADFYALARTMIQLLTGKYPPNLEDPVTGELRWRSSAEVSPGIANLLDDMAQADVRQRLGTDTAVQARLARLQKSATPAYFKVAQTGWDWSWMGITAFAKGFSQTTLSLFGIVGYLVQACLGTIWAMLLGGAGACVGTAAGFLLVYWSPWGDRIISLVQHLLHHPQVKISVGLQPILFAAVGWGTAWGLTVSGSFGQRRQYLVASLMGSLGYGLGRLAWQVTTPDAGIEGLLGSMAIAGVFLTLGLGLPSHRSVHAVVATLGTTAIFAGLANSHLLTTALHFNPQPGWLELLVCIAFFAFVSTAFSFWLAVSYYLIVPVLRFLGWR